MGALAASTASTKAPAPRFRAPQLLWPVTDHGHVERGLDPSCWYYSRRNECLLCCQRLAYLYQCWQPHCSHRSDMVGSRLGLVRRLAWIKPSTPSVPSKNNSMPQTPLPQAPYNHPKIQTTSQLITTTTATSQSSYEVTHKYLNFSDKPLRQTHNQGWANVLFIRTQHSYVLFKRAFYLCVLLRSNQKNVSFSKFFHILFKRTFRSLRSFTFFAKERFVLCILREHIKKKRSF